MLSKYVIYLTLLPFTVVLSKWVISFYYYGDFFNDFKYFLNFNDQQYFPYIISLSNLDFSPSHNSLFQADGVTSFPYASILFHALLFKILDLPSIIFLELIFYILVYYLVYSFLRKSNVNKISASFTASLIFFSPVILEYVDFFFKNINFVNIKDLIFNYHLISLRFPRPLVTNLFFYTSLLILINFLKNDFEKKKDYVLFGIILSLLIQSFIYLFIVIGLVYFILSVSNIFNNKEKVKIKLKYNFVLILVFLVVTLPFIFQNIYAEDDYVARIGLFPINFEKKKLLFRYTVEHYLGLNNIIFISAVILFCILFKKKFKKKYSLSIRLYLILVISSYIAPLLFIIFSPYIVWFKHFFDVKNLIFILGIFLFSALIIENYFYKIILTKLLVFYFILFGSGHIFYQFSIIKNNFLTNQDYFNDLNKVIIYSDEIINDKKKNNIFSNSIIINNYYIYKKQNITYPDGFSNALNDDKMENLMINSLKSIGYSSLDFKNLLKNKISWRYFNEIFQISHLKYQFSYLYTYSNIEDYSDYEIEFLKKRNFFWSESIALSNKEVNRLSDKFDAYKVIDEISPNIVIIDKKQFDVKPSSLNNYNEIFDTKYFRLIARN